MQRIRQAGKVKVRNSRRYEIAVSLHLLRLLHYRLHLLCLFPAELRDNDHLMVFHNFQSRCLQLLTYDAAFLAEVSMLCMAAVGAADTAFKNASIVVSPPLCKAQGAAAKFCLAMRHGDWLQEARVNPLTVCMPLTGWPGELWQILTCFFPLLTAAQSSIADNGAADAKRVDLMHPQSPIGGPLSLGDFVAQEQQRYKEEYAQATRRVPACELCGARGCLQLCSRCKVVSYCSKDHQAKHWRLHHRSLCLDGSINI